MILWLKHYQYTIESVSMWHNNSKHLNVFLTNLELKRKAKESNPWLPRWATEVPRVTVWFTVFMLMERKLKE